VRKRHSTEMILFGPDHYFFPLATGCIMTATWD